MDRRQKRSRSAQDGEALQARAYEGLERRVPPREARLLRKLREPRLKALRLMLGGLFIAMSFLWFLPVAGIEMLPLGLLLIAQDVPFLRKPVGRAMLWLEDRWDALYARWQQHRARHHGARHP